MVSMVEELCLKYNISKGAITVTQYDINTIKKSMESETIYSYLSNHFNSIPKIGHKILKSTPTWLWLHIKGQKYDQSGTLDRWDTLNED